MSIISNLIRKSTKNNGPLNILSFWYDGRFDIELLKTGHNFYGDLNTSAYPWPAIKNAPYPNLRILPNLNEIHQIDFDLIIFNHREVHRQFFDISKSLHVPSIIIDHDIDMGNAFFRLQNQTKHESISCCKAVQEQYSCQHNINYGIEQKQGEYDKDIDILICGNYTDNELNIIHNLKKNFPSLKLVGNNPKLSYSETVDTFEDYVNLFKRTKVFMNLALQRNIQYEILWALQYKCAILTKELEVYNGLLNSDNCCFVNSIEDIVPSINNLVYDKSKYSKITSHNTNLSSFDMNLFISKWNNIFENYRNKAYIQ